MFPAADAQPLIAAGAGAAKLLETAFGEELGPSDARRTGLVRELAADIRNQLEALESLTASDFQPDLMAEAALRCADLANLAACNLDGLPAAGAARAAASVHLTAGTVRALRLLAEGSGDFSETHPAALRDLRGAGWRVDLAVRQVEELLEAAPES